MDVIVTKNIQRTRQYRVNDVNDTKEAVGKVATLDVGDELPEKVTILDENQTENVTHSTSAAPPRPANPTAAS